jgi:hypothetical protein
VGGKAGKEDVLDDLDGQSSDGRHKSLVCLYVGTECVALLGELVKRLLDSSDFIL